MAQTGPSAGLLMFKKETGGLQVFLAHPGGPFFRNKHAGWWMLPKGEVNPGEDLRQAAIREFEEETGIRVPTNAKFLDLGSVKQKGGKIVYAWGFEDRLNEEFVSSIEFELEWPPKSGKLQKFPEVDQAKFFPLELAK